MRKNPVRFLLGLCGLPLLLAAAAGLLTSQVATAADSPPASFIDKGACPGKCCKYGLWKALKEFTVFDKENPTKKIAVVKPGMMFTGQYGEVRSTPYEVKLVMDDDKIKAGETAYLLTDQGEGFYKAWYKGQIVMVNEASTDKAEREKTKKLESAWWVAVKLEDGRMGWMKEDRQFDPIKCSDK
jgi:hypothetical protein